MLVDDDADRAASLEESLSASGFDVVSIISSTSALFFQIEQHRPDVILLDLNFPGRDTLESLAVINHHNPIPMVMFNQDDDADFIREAFEAGVSTYQTEGVQPEKVKPIIEVAIAQFRSYQTLRQELASAKNQLEEHKLQNKAKLLLMQQKNITEDDAHKMLNKLAMDNNLKRVEVAKTVIATLGSNKEIDSD